MLAELGDLGVVVAASEQRILQVEGANEWVFYHLRLVDGFAERLSQARLRNRDVVSSWDALVTYCRTAMAHGDKEHFRVLYLDRKNQLIADEEQAEGTVDHVPVYPREIAKRSLELNASSIILVHNHPSGDPTPPPEDVEMTKKIEAACEMISVAVHDHIIVGGDSETSFKLEMLL